MTTEIKTLDNYTIKETDSFYSVISKINSFLKIEPIFFRNEPKFTKITPIFRYKKNANLYCKLYNSALDNGFSIDNAKNNAIQKIENNLKINKIMITIKFATLENEAGTKSLKQHAYREAQRGSWYSEKYQGNKQLCGKGGVHDGDKFVSIEEIDDEGIYEKGICKKCLKIYNAHFKKK